MQPCRGNEADCPPPREPNGTPTYLPPATNMGMGGYSYDGYEAPDPSCETSQWSSWSPCSKKCGSGFQRRTRLYLIPFVPNRSCDVRLYDKQDCYGTATDCDNYGYFRDSCKLITFFSTSLKIRTRIEFVFQIHPWMSMKSLQNMSLIPTKSQRLTEICLNWTPMMTLQLKIFVLHQWMYVIKYLGHCSEKHNIYSFLAW